MKAPSTNSILFRGFLLSLLIAVMGGGTSCMTTYDSEGRPVQSVDPGAAVAGAAAAGLIGYALANDDDRYDHYRGRYHGHYHGRHYRRPPHRGHYRRY